MTVEQENQPLVTVSEEDTTESTKEAVDTYLYQGISAMWEVGAMQFFPDGTGRGKAGLDSYTPPPWGAKINYSLMGAAGGIGLLGIGYKIYWNKQKIRQMKLAFGEFISKENKKISQDKLEEIQKDIQNWSDTIFGDVYHVQLNWQEDNTLDSKNPLFLIPKNPSYTYQETSILETVSDLTAEGWNFWSYYSYGAWVTWYISEIQKLGSLNPVAVAVLGFILPGIYIIIQAGITLKNKIINRYISQPALITREFNAVEYAKQFQQSNITSEVAQVPHQEAEMYLMQTYLMKKYYQDWDEKFIAQCKKIPQEPAAQNSVQNAAGEPESPASPEQKPEQQPALSALKKKFWTSKKKMAASILIAFLFGAFAWYVDSLFNQGSLTGFLGNFGIATAVKSVLLVTMVTTGVAIGLGVVFGIREAYLKYKSLKRDNKKIDEKYLKIRQEKIAGKINNLKVDYRSNKPEENFKDTLKSYIDLVDEKTALVKRRVQENEKRREASRLKSRISDLKKYIMWAADKGRDSINAEILLKKYHDELEELSDIKQLDFWENVQDSIKGFIIKHPSVEFLRVFLSKDDKFRKKIAKIKKAENGTDAKNIKEYNKKIRQQNKLKLEIERQTQKLNLLEQSNTAYKKIDLKLAAKKTLTKKIRALNQEFIKNRPALIKAIDKKISLIKSNSNKETELEELKNLKITYLSDDMMNPHLRSTSWMLAHGERMAEFSNNKNLSVKERFKKVFDNAVAGWNNFRDTLEGINTGIYIATSILRLLVSVTVLTAYAIFLAAKIASTVFGLAFVGKYFYDKYEEKQRAIKEGYFERTPEAEFVLEENIRRLKKIETVYTSRNTDMLARITALTEKNTELEKEFPHKYSAAVSAGCYLAKMFFPQVEKNNPNKAAPAGEENKIRESDGIKIKIDHARFYY